MTLTPFISYLPPSTLPMSLALTVVEDTPTRVWVAGSAV